MTRKPTVSEARTSFRYHLVSRGLSEQTVKNHMQTLNRWLALVGDTRIDHITSNHVDRFFGEGNWSPKTQNLYLSLLRGVFFPWCRRQGFMPRDSDPTEGWRNAKSERSEQLWLPVDEFPSLLEAADNPRDRAVIALGLYTFARGSELSTLRIQDVDLDKNLLTFYRWKTKDADLMPISAELWEEMDRYLAYYKVNQGFEIKPEWFLVPVRSKTVPVWDYENKVIVPGLRREADLLPTQRLYRPYEPVKRALRKLGYDPKGSGAHTLRRSGARALFDRLRSEGYDGSLRRVSSMLGHKDTKTTEIYLGLSLEREQRNELIAGQVMFPSVRNATVIPLREVNGGYRG